MIAAIAFMWQAATVTLPYPWLEYCWRARDPGCVVEAISPRDLALINMAVTEAITTEENPDPLDPWTPFPADRRGDCDDDAATKRAALLALGMDPKAMRFETGRVIEPDGREVGHIVLVVSLAGRDYVLDRRTPDRVYTPSRRPYAWTATASEPDASPTWTEGNQK